MLVNLPTDFEGVYPCCDPDGERLRANLSLPCRSTPADPCRRDGEAWAHRMPGHRFPYRVETLTGDGRTVLIVEGEKCADLAARVFNRI